MHATCNNLLQDQRRSREIERRISAMDPILAGHVGVPLRYYGNEILGVQLYPPPPTPPGPLYPHPPARPPQLYPPQFYPPHPAHYGAHNMLPMHPPLHPPSLIVAHYQQPSPVVEEESESVSPPSTPTEQQGTPTELQYSVEGPPSEEATVNDLEETGDEQFKDYRRFSGRSRKRTDFFSMEGAKRSGNEGDREQGGDKEGQQQQRGGSWGRERGHQSPPYVAGTRNDAAVYVPADLAPSRIRLVANNLKAIYPIGRMVFAKLPGYPWWAGYVASHRFCEGQGRQLSKLWIQWYGESDMSHIQLDKIEPFEDFKKWYSPSEMKRDHYKASLIIALETAARRGKIEFSSDPKNKMLNWVLPEGRSTPVLASEKAALETRATTSEEATANPEESSGAGRQKKRRKMSGRNRGHSRKSTKKNCVYFTNYEYELLEWAIDGFLPLGGDAFWPSESDQEELEQEVGPVPVGPSGKATEEVPVEAPARKRAKITSTKPILRANFAAVSEGKLALADICLSCGDKKTEAQHPLFEGGLCKVCKGIFLQCTYQFDDDGSQMYCSICSGGDEVYMCDTENCAKVFCGPCIEKLCGAQELKEVIEAQNWTCYMCKDVPSVGMLAKRADWDLKLRELFDSDHEIEYDPPPSYPPIPPDERRPMRVLGLFDGIGTGCLVLKELGLEVDKYIASEISPEATNVPSVPHYDITHIEHITPRQVKDWGPFDLVFGGNGCSAGGAAVPKHFFNFYRLLLLAMPQDGEDRPFFWLYENVVSMQPEDKSVICRLLNCNPVVVDAKEISAAHRARYFWGNLPGMNRPLTPLPGDRLYVQELFDFCEHYTDVCRRSGRQKLLGKAWSVPVIRHLLSPLKDYFKSCTTMDEDYLTAPGNLLLSTARP